MDSAHMPGITPDNPQPAPGRGIGPGVREYVTLLQRERDEARAALRQLVALKDDKDRHGKTPEYEQLQPIAWQAARKVLGTTSQPECPQEDKTDGSQD